MAGERSCATDGKSTRQPDSREEKRHRKRAAGGEENKTRAASDSRCRTQATVSQPDEDTPGGRKEGEPEQLSFQTGNGPGKTTLSGARTARRFFFHCSSHTHKAQGGRAKRDNNKHKDGEPREGKKEVVVRETTYPLTKQELDLPVALLVEILDGHVHGKQLCAGKRGGVKGYGRERDAENDKTRRGNEAWRGSFDLSSPFLFLLPLFAFFGVSLSLSLCIS